jgi:hypothetical protein
MLKSFSFVLRKHWALTDSRPCANVTLLLRRVAHLFILRAVDLAAALLEAIWNILVVLARHPRH